MIEDKMVKPADHSSGTERADDHIIRKHGRSSSSEQAISAASYSNSIIKSIEPSSTPASPSRSKHNSSERPHNKRRKSSISGKTKTRPTYSRKYSTPPSRPLSPAGFPKHLDLDMAIPEIDLNEASAQLMMSQQYLSVDTAPQNPDIWSDPETDYFSTIEGPGPKHPRGKSRRQISQPAHNVNSLNAMMAASASANAKGLRQIKEDAEADFLLPPTPGAFAS